MFTKSDFFINRTVKSEFLAYDLGSLVGDLGGMVGMLLGASILALYDLAYSSMLRIFKKVPSKSYFTAKS